MKCFAKLLSNKDIHHLFRGCAASIAIWDQLRPSLPPRDDHVPFQVWFRKLLKHQHVVLAVAALWWIWKTRNERVFNNNAWPFQYIIRQILHDAKHWKSWALHSQENTAMLQDVPRRKVPCLFVDGSWNTGLKRMDCGGMLTDVDGNWLSGFSVSFGHGNAFLSELLAIEHGLRLAWNLGYRELVCATDCRDAITALNTLDTTSFWASHTLSRIKDMLHWDWTVTLESISRNNNLVADALACAASRDGSPHCVWRFPPSFVVPLICHSISA